MNGIVLYCENQEKAVLWDACKNHPCEKVKKCLFKSASAAFGCSSIQREEAKRFCTVDEMVKDQRIMKVVRKPVEVPPDVVRNPR